LDQFYFLEVFCTGLVPTTLLVTSVDGIIKNKKKYGEANERNRSTHELLSAV
jgi:hypothetical protein